MADETTNLERLVDEPMETLAVEYKGWLDLRSKPQKAKLAKELIALANHGGGHVVLGFDDPDMTPQARPADYGYVNTDYVNGLVDYYAEPNFHCEVHEVRRHIIVAVPAGMQVPVRSKRGSEGKELKANTYYIRRPGPNSEEPQSGLEWNQLLDRCFANRDAELERVVRRVLRAREMVAEDATPQTDPFEELLR